MSRYGIRVLSRRPGFTAVGILTLALGIGATAAIFTVVNAVLLRPLPFRDPERLVLLVETMRQFPTVTTSWQNYVDWRDQRRSFDAVAAFRNTTMTLTAPASLSASPRRSSQQACCPHSASSRFWGGTSRRPTTRRAPLVSCSSPPVCGSPVSAARRTCQPRDPPRQHAVQDCRRSAWGITPDAAG